MEKEVLEVGWKALLRDMEDLRLRFPALPPPELVAVVRELLKRHAGDAIMSQRETTVYEVVRICLAADPGDSSHARDGKRAVDKWLENKQFDKLETFLTILEVLKEAEIPLDQRVMKARMNLGRLDGSIAHHVTLLRIGGYIVSTSVKQERSYVLTEKGKAVLEG